LSRFGPDPLEFFNLMYQHSAPWDIGAPQPAMVALLERYPPTGPILDLGCGPSDLAIHLAKLGYRVVGIDFVESAIQNARAKAATLPPEASRLLNFEVADAFQLSQLQQTFAAVVDSGFYHLFNPDESERLIDEVRAILLPSGRYYLHEFAIEFPAPNLPRQISAEEIEARFTIEKGWRIVEIQSVDFLSRVAPPVPATCACIERLH
jgi:SAM-dependent methyltransferase